MIIFHNVKCEMKFRLYKDFISNEFESELKDSELCIVIAHNLDKPALQYNVTLFTLLDKHAIVINETQTQDRKTPWYTQENYIEKREGNCKSRSSKTKKE